MADIYIKRISSTFIQLDCDAGIMAEISPHFAFYVPGYQFTPKFKMRIWDGKIRLLKEGTGVTYLGLIKDVIRVAETLSYTVELDQAFAIDFADVDPNPIDFLSTLTLKKEPRDFQLKAYLDSVKRKRQLNLSSTGSGKSYILYLICRYLETQVDRILIIVPSTNLCEQLRTDFIEYAELEETYDVDERIQLIYGGASKELTRPFIISTWQGIQYQDTPKANQSNLKKYKKKPQVVPQNEVERGWFAQLDAVLVDEVHLYSSKTTSSIVENCVNAVYKLGFTGTLAESKTNEMMLRALFGPVKTYSTSKELMDEGILAQLKLTVLALNYTKEHLSKKIGTDYQSEVEFIEQSIERRDFLARLALNLEGNTLFLFAHVQNHAKPFYEYLLEQKDHGKEIYLFTGGVDVEDREEIRRLINEKSNMIIIASYSVASTGVNMVGLNNMVLASPTKSKIRVLQSIGRALRVSKTKKHANVYDIVDVLSHTRKKSFAAKHFEERLNQYTKEGFDVRIKEFQL